MPKFKLQVMQVYRVERAIVLEVEADDIESAIEEQSAGAEVAFNDPRWETDWDLQNEEVAAL